jgi:hypothetical protein
MADNRADEATAVVDAISSERKRVVIVGGGFAGLAAARAVVTEALVNLASAYALPLEEERQDSRSASVARSTFAYRVSSHISTFCRTDIRKGTEEDQRFIVLAIRKPRVSKRTLMLRLKRTAVRTSSLSLRQEAPRITR